MYSANLCVLVAGISLIGFAGEAAPAAHLYKSTDHGASWFQIGQGLASDARINSLDVVSEVVVAGTDRGIFVSRDAGMRWQPARKGVGTEARILCLTHHGERILAGTEKNGVISSEDNGLTWKPANSGLTDLYIRSLLVVGTKVYAGTDSQGVFVSENAGISWAARRTGLPELSQVFDLAAVGDTVFAGLYSKGLYRWDAGHGMWVKSGDVAPLELAVVGETLVVGHNPGGVFVSADRGKTWTDGNEGLPFNVPVWTLAAADDRVFAGASGTLGFSSEKIGLFTSIDRGRSWSRSDAGLPPSAAAISFVITKHFVLAGISESKN